MAYYVSSGQLGSGGVLNVDSLCITDGGTVEPGIAGGMDVPPSDGKSSGDVLLRDFALISTAPGDPSGQSDGLSFPASETAAFTVEPAPEQTFYALSESNGDPVGVPEIEVDAAPGDTLLPYAMPQAEYMYGCSATAIGMLLGYYDLYGYTCSSEHYDFSNLIEGTISLNSRGSDGGSIYDMNDPSVLAQFIASPEYVSRFYEQTPEHELPYTYVNSDPEQGLNIAVWNCLADYLGTGQYWRGNGDLSTPMYYASLDYMESYDFTFEVGGSYTIPALYHEFKYGLSLYVASRGFQLDAAETRTVEIASFSFEEFMAEIDAGRPVLLSMQSPGGGHMVIAYGYNASTQEVIFDDTYRANCRMTWTGTFEYADQIFQLSAVSTVVFDVSTLSPESFKVELYSDSTLVSAANIMTGKTLDAELNRMLVFSGGTANNTAVNSGELVVFSGGTANSTTVKTGGLLLVSGGTANSATVDSGGTMYVSSGGTANSTDLRGVWWTNGAWLYVSDGGTATSTTVSSGGSLHVLSGGTTDFTIVSSCGVMYVSSGGTANKTSIFFTGQMHVSSGATANLTSISHGYLYACGGTANSTTVCNDGYLMVSSGGTATSTTVNSGGFMKVSSGGTANFTTINGGIFSIHNGGTANYTTLNYGGSKLDCDMVVYGGATANYTTVNSGVEVLLVNGGSATSTTVNSGGMLEIDSGTADHSWINSGGSMFIWSGCTATNIVAAAGAQLNIAVASNTFIQGTSGGSAFVMTDANITGHTVNSGGSLTIFAGAAANSTTVNSRSYMKVSSGGRANSTVVSSSGSMFVSSGGKATGTLQIASGAVVSAYAGSIIDFDISGRAGAGPALVNNLSLVRGTPDFTITVSADQEFGLYTLAGGAAGFTGTLSIGTTETNYGSITVNGDELIYADYSFTLATEGSDLLLTVTGYPEHVSGNASGLSWTENPEDADYVVEYSQDNFNTALTVKPGTSRLDSYGLPAGTYQWRARPAAGEDWTLGQPFVVDGEVSAQLQQSDADGNMDVFFTRSVGTWGSTYYAQHQGTEGGWEGTGETVSLGGKNRIEDVFTGSTDANVLVMSDAANGDALFLDDTFSVFPEIQQGRLEQIDEIRAGAGDDVVDMTSQLFGYVGDGLTIRGGLGDDAIWANSGDNVLFGDAGNDRLIGAAGDDILVGGVGCDSMHGGGGNDIFTFCDDWGIDTVEQLEGGSVTLWFASGDVSNWDEVNLAYDDGCGNFVQVSGVSSAQITLKFGDDGSALFDDLTALGAFAECTSEKIFEDESKGMLA